MADIGFVASCIMDLTFDLEDFPDPGETVMAGGFDRGFGGKGANQAVAAAKTGAEVSVLGAVGTDQYGDRTIENFTNHGIDADYVFQLDDSGTGLASICVDATGENMIAVAPGANLDLDPAWLDDVPDDWFDCEFVSGVNEFDEALLLACFRRARDHGATTVLNAAPARPISDELWACLDCLIVNESEAEFYVNKTPEWGKHREVIQAFLDRGLESVVLTLGATGSIYADADERVRRPAPDVDAVDTTGAGDAFIGAFLSARSRGLGPGGALDAANRYAAESVKGEGTQKSFPDDTL